MVRQEAREQLDKVAEALSTASAARASIPAPQELRALKRVAATGLLYSDAFCGLHELTKAKERKRFSTKGGESMTQNRWHNILGGPAEWDRIRTDFEVLHKRAEDAGFELTIVDDQCPCCGFRPCFEMKERRVKKSRITKPGGTGK
jgi:hypothetical protein